MSDTIFNPATATTYHGTPCKFGGLPSVAVGPLPGIGLVVHIEGDGVARYLMVRDDPSSMTKLAQRGILHCLCGERVYFVSEWDGLTLIFPWMPALGWCVDLPSLPEAPAPETPPDLTLRVRCPRCIGAHLTLAQRLFTTGLRDRKPDGDRN